MRNIYLIDPYLATLETRVANVRSSTTYGQMIELEQTIIRADGGGQPADKGFISLPDGPPFPVTSIEKRDGKTWLAVPALSRIVLPGQEISCSIDETRRNDLMRCHSLVHLLMAAIRWNVPGYESRGACIEDDARTCRLWFAADKFDGDRDLCVVDKYARSVIAQGLALKTFNIKSVDVGRTEYPHWRVDPSLGLIGKVRVVEIAGVDMNPCSGTHLSATSEIGPFSVAPVILSKERGCFELVATREETWQYWYSE